MKAQADARGVIAVEAPESEAGTKFGIMLVWSPSQAGVQHRPPTTRPPRL